MQAGELRERQNLQAIVGIPAFVLSQMEITALLFADQ